MLEHGPDGSGLARSLTGNEWDTISRTQGKMLGWRTFPNGEVGIILRGCKYLDWQICQLLKWDKSWLVPTYYLTWQFPTFVKDFSEEAAQTGESFLGFSDTNIANTCMETDNGITICISVRWRLRGVCVCRTLLLKLLNAWKWEFKEFAGGDFK